MLKHVVPANALMDDPIRRSRYYLTTDHLSALSLPENGNVVPWRIYQNPGQAVLIPAGCAHQVCNLSGCIKVACDFVSPENQKRSWEVCGFDRKLARLGRREDVLQLKNVVYFAWRKLVYGLMHPTPTQHATGGCEQVGVEAEATVGAGKDNENESSLSASAAAANEIEKLRSVLTALREEMRQSGWRC